MTDWKSLARLPSASVVYTYGRGEHRRTALRISDSYGKSKRNAKRRGITFTLSPEDYASLWRDDCALCCEIFRVTPCRWYCRSLDRIDASQGYEAGNCRFLCYGCNVTLGLDAIATSRRKKRIEEPCL